MANLWFGINSLYRMVGPGRGRMSHDQSFRWAQRTRILDEDSSNCNLIRYHTLFWGLPCYFAYDPITIKLGTLKKGYGMGLQVESPSVNPSAVREGLLSKVSRLPAPAKCSSSQRLLVYIKWYLGYLRGGQVVQGCSVTAGRKHSCFHYGNTIAGAQKRKNKTVCH